MPDTGVMIRSAIGWICAAVLVTGCTRDPAPLPTPNAFAAARCRASPLGKARFRFKIPHRRSGSRGSHYVSQEGTASIAVTVYDSSHTHQLAQAVIETAPGAAGCTAVVAGTYSCSFVANVPAGNDTFDATTYDAANATGRKLSAIADFPFLVVAGKSNAVALTLGGIAATLDIALAGNSIFASGSTVSGFAFGGNGTNAAQHLRITAKDADGYTIVDPGMPVIALKGGDANHLSIASVHETPGLFCTDSASANERTLHDDRDGHARYRRPTRRHVQAAARSDSV